MSPRRARDGASRGGVVVRSPPNCRESARAELGYYYRASFSSVTHFRLLRRADVRDLRPQTFAWSNRGHVDLVAEVGMPDLYAIGRGSHGSDAAAEGAHGSFDTGGDSVEFEERLGTDRLGTDRLGTDRNGAPGTGGVASGTGGAVSNAGDVVASGVDLLPGEVSGQASGEASEQAWASSGQRPRFVRELRPSVGDERRVPVQVQEPVVFVVAHHEADLSSPQQSVVPPPWPSRPEVSANHIMDPRQGAQGDLNGPLTPLSPAQLSPFEPL
jgi:hypothetical protein